MRKENINDTKILRTAIYIRVSSEEQARNGDSLRDQKESCLDYIKRHHNTELQDLYIDDGISGQKLERTEFTRLIENARLGKIDLIIFTKLDRWFRNLRHYLNTQATLEEHNVSWLAVDQPYFDTSTPHGRAFVAQSMTWAELEAQNDGIRIRDVFASKVRNREVITGKVPRGYKIVNKHLELSEDAPAVLDLFNYFLKTNSMGKTLQYAREEYGMVMTINNLRQSIFENVKYTGRYRDIEDYCPQIVSDEIFESVNKILKERKNVKTGQRYPYIFSGILVCDECKHKMSGCHINVKSRKYHYRYPAYECKYYRANKMCDNGGEIREKTVEEYMLAHIRPEMEAYIKQYTPDSMKQVDNRVKKAGIQKKISRLKEAYLAEVITLDEYKSDRDELQKQYDSLPDIIESTHDLSMLKALLDSNFEEAYEDLTNEEKRRFWRSIVREIRVSKSTERIRKYSIDFI